jgi:hypothetical protein
MTRPMPAGAWWPATEDAAQAREGVGSDAEVGVRAALFALDDAGSHEFAQMMAGGRLTQAEALLELAAVQLAGRRVQEGADDQHARAIG